LFILFLSIKHYSAIFTLENVNDVGYSCLFVIRTQTQWALRQYIIKKDLFTGFKAREFSIYDHHLLYRLQSRYALTQGADLYVYPGLLPLEINGLHGVRY
jgi:hypothetical protein